MSDPEVSAPAAQPARAPAPPRGVDIIQVLTTAVQKGGSDIVFTVGSKPRIRIGGKLRIYGEEVLTPEVTKKMLYSLLNDDQRTFFEENWEIDLAVNIKNVGRFRLNGFRQRGHVAAVLRSIPSKLPTCEQLQLPPVLVDIADYPRGLVLVTGPTGSGKSTLLAALINKINSEKEVHIISIEDPVEFVHPHARAVVEQREVGSDTKSFKAALKYILRQNPDVILVGEMRDPETIGAAITLAETGHLVFSTLHTQTCAQTMDRIIDAFPHEAQNQVRSQLALTLKAVVSQTLLPVPDGGKCVAAREIMIVTPAIAALLREGKGHMITNAIQTGRAQGMITMEDSINGLIENNLADVKVAMARINQVRTYTSKDGGGLPAAKPVEEEQKRPAGPMEVEDMPDVGSAVPTPSRPGSSMDSSSPLGMGDLPDLKPGWQPVVLVLLVLALAGGVFASSQGKAAPFPSKYAFGAAAALAVVWVLRYQAERKRALAALRRMINES